MIPIDERIGLGLALVLGLLTSFHCVGMCRGFIVAYTTANEKAKRNTMGLHAWYALGKLASRCRKVKRHVATNPSHPALVIPE